MSNSKKESRFPFYLITIVFPGIFWCLLCAFLGLFIILGKADFDATGTKVSFVVTTIVYVISAVISGAIETGLMRVLSLKKIEKGNFKFLNDIIKNGHIPPDLSAEDLKKTFKLIATAPKDGTILAGKYIVGVIILVILTEFITSGTTKNIPVIFLGGLISLILAVSFGGFYIGYSIFPILKECKLLLLKKGVKIEKEIAFWDMRKKFVLFLLFPFFIVLMTLGFFGAFNFYILILLIIGILMSFVISQLISFSIYQTFADTKEFIKKLPQSEKVIFATGSLDRDILELSNSLNLAAEEAYLSRKRLEESRERLEEKVAERTKELKKLAESLEEQVKEKTKKLQQRVNELEEFHRLTVGRELRMVELKKEIEKLNEQLGELKKNNEIQTQ